MKEDMNKCAHPTSIGGEALIEGVMMKGPENIAIAIRKPDGEILVDKKPLRTLSKRHKFFKLPLVRGAVGIFESMVIGVQSLMYSAEFFEVEEDHPSEPSKLDKFLERVLGEKLQSAVIYFSVLVAMAFSIGLFILLPNVVAGLMNFDRHTPGGVLYYNLFEGALRVLLFIGYIILISKMKDVRRVFEYHGAEHKTIHCYEHEEELTVENVKKYTTRHPRCGTAFLLVVMLVSILVFSFTGWHNMVLNIIFRLLLLPLVAGLSYEVIKYAGRNQGRMMRIVSAPGLALQRFTTREPDDRQIEVAIAALKNVLVDDPDADRW
ncbi:MAG: DUF1385 domain-containing protein [Clostridiales bacterium]|nr:DUF1385 domain-containing protein [Eubacteriales bacterium]MDH7567044.1 DUF1385 domain-containing protein [Clostridiales bacterium]